MLKALFIQIATDPKAIEEVTKKLDSTPSSSSYIIYGLIAVIGFLGFIVSYFYRKLQKIKEDEQNKIEDKLDKIQDQLTLLLSLKDTVENISDNLNNHEKKTEEDVKKLNERIHDLEKEQIRLKSILQ